MNSRRKFLQLLGLAAPAAALLPKAEELPKMLHPTGIPFADPPDPAGLVQPESGQTYRYLGLAQLKNEGEVCAFENWPGEISQFAKEAFGRKELYQWPDFEEDEEEA